MHGPWQVAKFGGVHSLDMHFPSNFGASTTRIRFIGLKGDFTERKREAVTAVYELRPVPGAAPPPRPPPPIHTSLSTARLYSMTLRRAVLGGNSGDTGRPQPLRASSVRHCPGAVAQGPAVRYP